MRKRFKDATMQRCYEAMRTAGADPKSYLYAPDGSRRTGSIDRVRYWQGRDGIAPTGTVRNSIAYACWRAGMDDRARKP